MAKDKKSKSKDEDKKKAAKPVAAKSKDKKKTAKPEKAKSKTEKPKDKKKSSKPEKVDKKKTAKPEKSSKSAKKVKPVKKEKESTELKPVKKGYSQTELIQRFAEKIQEVQGFPEDNERLAKAVSKKFFELLTAQMQGSIHPKGHGEFVLPGMFKIVTTKVPAKKMPEIKKGTEVRNPATGEMMKSAGRKAFTKPASVRVKIRPMKKLKDAALS